MEYVRKMTFLALLIFSFAACNEGADVRGIPDPAEVEAVTDFSKSVKESAEELERQGYKTFVMEEKDTTYLMQQYYMVFLKRGATRNQDSTEATRLQQEHLAHLSRMAREGYASLIGPMGDDGEVRGIVVFNTPTQEMADSLARLDPMVQAGRLEVEVHPWWAAKGGKLE